MGPFDVTGAAMTGRLVEVDVGVEGMPLFRGAIGLGSTHMKIAKIEAIPVSYPEPNDFNALRHLCLAKITADDGQVGWGESITQFPEANFATKAIIEGMAPNLIGKDPVADRGAVAAEQAAGLVVRLSRRHRLLRHRRDRHRAVGPQGQGARQERPRPARRLRPRDACRRSPRATRHYESIEEMADETAEWVSTGLQGLKTGFGKRGNANLGYDHNRDVAYVKAMREVLGDKMLMIDNGINIKWDVTDAVRRAKAMEEYDLAWIEEPLGAWDPEGYANLRAKTTTRIAYGEREWTLEQFERVLATGTVDVIGVDPGRAEGITGFKKVTERCEFYRRQANAHAWSSAIVTAASLAISFNSPSCKLFEFKPLRNPMQHDLVTKPFEHIDGWVYPPTGPGLGIEVIEEVVEGYRSEKVLGKL